MAFDVMSVRYIKSSPVKTIADNAINITLRLSTTYTSSCGAGMLYVDHAGVVSKSSPGGRTNMMAVIVTVYISKAAALTVSEKKY